MIHNLMGTIFHEESLFESGNANLIRQGLLDGLGWFAFRLICASTSPEIANTSIAATPWVF
jgi:hypothetical protein